jgi:hypothetical protein
MTSPAPEVMPLEAVQNELRAISGHPLRGDQDAIRRQQLWRRLDELLKVDEQHNQQTPSDESDREGEIAMGRHREHAVLNCMCSICSEAELLFDLLPRMSEFKIVRGKNDSPQIVLSDEDQEVLSRFMDEER